MCIPIVCSLLYDTQKCFCILQNKGEVTGECHQGAGQADCDAREKDCDAGGYYPRAERRITRHGVVRRITNRHGEHPKAMQRGSGSWTEVVFS